MVSEGRGRLFRRKDGKYLIYVPLGLATDSMFPFKLEEHGDEDEVAKVNVKISFKTGDNKLLIEEWEEPQSEP